MTDDTQLVTKNEKLARHTYPDRFTVDPPGLEKIGRWLTQLRAAVPACEVTRKDILGWIIEKAPDELGTAELKDLSDRFYDEERFLKLALEEIRAAKARGERLSLDDILQRKSQAAPAPVRKPPRKRKADSSPSSEEEALTPALSAIVTSE